MTTTTVLRKIGQAVGLLLLAGCAISPSGMPAKPIGIPWRESTFDGTVHQARRKIDQGRSLEALALLEDLLAREPRNVDAHRVRQDILRGRGRIGLVLHEAEQRLVDWGEDDAHARYLFGRLQPTDGRKQAAFESVIQGSPQSFWGWFGFAFTQRSKNAELGLPFYQSLYDRTEHHGLVALALGETLRLAGEHERALEVYNEHRDDPSMVGIADRSIAETLMAAGRQQEAWPPLLEAIRRRPSDPGIRRVVHRLLAQGLARQYVEQILDVMFEDPARLEAFGQSSAGASLLAELFERAGNLPAARATLIDAANAADRSPPGAQAVRHRRQQQLAVGDVAGFLASLRSELPDFLVRDERNRTRGAWIRLLDGPWMISDDPLEDGRDAVRLCQALRDTGFLRAAELTATLALTRHQQAAERASLDASVVDAEIRQVRDEVRRQMAFEGAVRRVLYAGYQTVEGGEPDSLEVVLEKLRDVSRRILGDDVVGEPEIYSIPLVGRMVDPFESPFAEFLNRYNRHLVLGQRWAGTVEGMLFRRLSLRELEESADLPLDGRCMEVVGDDRRIRALGSVLGGDVAGVALLNHYIIDFDAVRDWAGSILQRRTVARADGLALLEDPLPEGGEPLDAVDQEWRLSLLSPVQDEDLGEAVFDMICAHERQHLVDAFYHLPPLTSPLRTLKLVFGHGFSPLSIESTMEGRAEAGALLASPHTSLVLAHIVGFLRSHSEGSPHAIGFRRFAEFVHERLLEDEELREFAAVRHWHRVPTERMRSLARDFLAR